MKLRLSIICIIACLLSDFVYSQAIQIEGKVIRKDNREPISGASVRVGDFGTISDLYGNFSLKMVDENNKNSCVVFSCIGYKDTIVTRILPGKFLLIELTIDDIVLPPVYITSSAKKIIVKAIQNIENNYSLVPLNILGIQNSIETINYPEIKYIDSALISAYIPPYNSKNVDIQVGILQNRAIKTVPTEKKSIVDKVHWEGIYYILADIDFVNKKQGIANMKLINSYDFKLNSIVFYNNLRCYSIDFKKNDNKKGIEGTVFIDTATFAFAGVTYTLNDKLKKSFEKNYDFDNSFTYVNVIYVKHSSRWYLSKFSGEQYGYKRNIGEDAMKRCSFNFVALEIDTLNVHHIPPELRVNRRDKLSDIKRDIDVIIWDSLNTKISEQTINAK